MSLSNKNSDSGGIGRPQQEQEQQQAHQVLPTVVMLSEMAKQRQELAHDTIKQQAAEYYLTFEDMGLGRVAQKGAMDHVLDTYGEYRSWLNREDIQHHAKLIKSQKKQEKRAKRWHQKQQQIQKQEEARKKPGGDKKFGTRIKRTREHREATHKAAELFIDARKKAKLQQSIVPVGTLQLICQAVERDFGLEPNSLVPETVRCRADRNRPGGRTTTATTRTTSQEADAGTPPKMEESEHTEYKLTTEDNLEGPNSYSYGHGMT